MSSEISIEDTFARDRLPSPADWPDLTAADAVHYADRLNVAVELVDANLEAGRADRLALVGDGGPLTYGELARAVARRANFLEAGGVLKGSRVLLRSPNNAELVCWWLAVLRIGALAVTTAPLLRAKELTDITAIAQPGFALVDVRLAGEWERVDADSVTTWAIDPRDVAGVDKLLAGHSDEHVACDTAATDLALLAFTSGSTGIPKATMHFHRDLLAIADHYAADVLAPTEDDVFIGSPPLAFTFGLGALVIFPLRFGATGVLLEISGPDALLEGIQRHGATRLFTAPTAYRAMAAAASQAGTRSLRTCVSAGETLPPDTLRRWLDATGHTILDGIGSTEMLHIFVSARPGDVLPGSAGLPVRGYIARIVDEDMNEVPPGVPGRLAVKGPTGCRYMGDPRQSDYVRQGWNLTGDIFSMSEDGHFMFQARSDDMILSAGYNITAAEVEGALLTHAAVREAAVVGAPDPHRGQIVSAYVVLAEGGDRPAELVKQLQEHVKAEIAPYKYPRAITFVDELPKTPTGKIQRFRLKDDDAVS